MTNVKSGDGNGSATGQGVRGSPCLGRVFWVLPILTGCAAIIGVPDLTFDERAGQDGGFATDGTAGDPDGSTPAPDGGGAIDCKADLKTDTQHCGACGHDCSHGICRDGLCTLRDGLGGPQALALTNEAVYVGLIGNLALQGVISCPKNGCASATVAPRRISPADAGYIEVFGLATSTQHVFATDYYGGNDGKLWRMDLAGGGLAHVPASGTQQRSYGIAMDSTHAYWVEANDPGGIFDCALPSCTTPHLIRALTSPELIAVAPDKRVVYTDQGGFGLWTCPSKDNCASPQEIPSVGHINGLVVDNGTVYWASRRQIFSCALSPLCATPAKEVDETSLVVTALAVSGSTLWYAGLPLNDAGAFVNEEGVIKTCAVGSCADGSTKVLATKQKAPEAMALDANSVYWANNGRRGYTDGIGSVVKAPR